MNQLGLPFSLNSKLLLDNFIGRKNQQVLDFVSQLFAQEMPSVLYVYGEKSSGKTHLLQGCAFAAIKKKLKVAYIDFEQELPDGAMDNLESLDWVCLDNVGCLNESQQQDLFDLYNRSVQTQVKLIISGNTLPNELDLLKDLKTRLSLATIFFLEPLDDDSKKIVMQSKMENRNIAIENKVYDYLFKYYSRDLTDLLSAVDQLDKASLQQKNKITIPLIKQVLDI
ncbi:DnaA regulatory inactivator Hda [Candidatus Thioglobus sp.]|jgi:regulatory inactivation of DnaA Hda protein|uniref:DnaA regulatory inactivator Hda n=1 Tax=Candidatus Thioglobus sp. TaxID=2026721 RepID=UPI00176F5634|nr:DnaA regulatory inactivator Hda [Candidatus Thioglobus sp.]